MEIPKRKGRPPDNGDKDSRQRNPASAPVSICGLTITENQIVSKGVKAMDVTDNSHSNVRAVDRRAATIPLEHETKALRIDK